MKKILALTPKLLVKCDHFVAVLSHAFEGKCMNLLRIQRFKYLQKASESRTRKVILLSRFQRVKGPTK